MPHLCPWWLAVAFDNPLRQLVHQPERLFRPYVRTGARVLDVGCGRGFATVALARLVGANGSVVAADLQPELLRMTERRVRRAGLDARVQLVQARADTLGVDGRFELANAFWMLHEVADPRRLLGEIRELLAPGGVLLVAEPKGHVSAAEFARTLELAAKLGLEPSDAPPVPLSRARILRRSD